MVVADSMTSMSRGIPSLGPTRLIAATATLVREGHLCGLVPFSLKPAAISGAVPGKMLTRSQHRPTLALASHR
jgi:hypothetical protein